MKTHLTVFALSAILIVSVGMAPAFGQSDGRIIVNTDKDSYVSGETIVISGTVRDLYQGTQAALKVTAPNGNLVTVGQLEVAADKTFSHEIKASGQIKASGTYIVEVVYGLQGHSARTTFEFSDTEVPTEEQQTVPVTPPPVVDPRVTATTVSFEGIGDVVQYSITGGTLLGIMPNPGGTSLVVSIDATEDGSLTLTIPRTILDAKTADGEDDDFIILVDLEEVEFEETTTDTARTVTVAFPAGAAEIEIIGTMVIPEFGAIAAMILAVAVIAVIAISARSRLSIVPRY